MNKHDERFLRLLHFRLFNNTEEEKRLSFNKDFDSDHAAHRNDQQISDCREHGKVIEGIISDFVEHCEHS